MPEVGGNDVAQPGAGRGRRRAADVGILGVNDVDSAVAVGYGAAGIEVEPDDAARNFVFARSGSFDVNAVPLVARDDVAELDDVLRRVVDGDAGAAVGDVGRAGGIGADAVSP